MQEYGQWLCNIKLYGEKIASRLVVLPMPPSENQRLEVDWEKSKEVVLGGMYANFKSPKKKGAMHNSRLYNQWKNAASNLLKVGKFEKLKGDLIVFVTLVFPDNRRRDADNRIKPLFDAFTQSGRLIEDDSQIVLHTVSKTIVKNKFCVIALVCERESLPSKLGFEMTQEHIEKLTSNVPDYSLKGKQNEIKDK